MQMTQAVQQLLEASKLLSLEERLDLVNGLWQGLGPNDDAEEFELSAADQRELQKRLDDWREHPETSLTLEQTLAAFATGELPP